MQTLCAIKVKFAHGVFLTSIDNINIGPCRTLTLLNLQYSSASAADGCIVHRRESNERPRGSLVNCEQKAVVEKWGKRIQKEGDAQMRGISNNFPRLRKCRKHQCGENIKKNIFSHEQFERFPHLNVNCSRSCRRILKRGGEGF